VPDWLAFPLLATAWGPLLVLLHELGHALAAMALTDGEVEIDMRAAGVFGGSVTYEPARLRRPRHEAWIAAAGPAVTLLVAAVLWLAWVESAADSLVTILGAGAFAATFQLATSAIPLHYGAGLGGPADSDGRAIWRILRGVPPGGLKRELRRESEPEPAARPMFVVVLVAVAALCLFLDPWLLVALVGLFGAATLMQRKA
jgi:hypothetical protein